MEWAGFVYAQQTGHVPSCKLPSTGHMQWTVLCSSAMESEDKLFPYSAGHFRTISGSFSHLFLFFP